MKYGISDRSFTKYCMKVNIDHAVNASLHLLIFLPEEPDITKRKSEAYFVNIFCNIVAIVTAVPIFKTEVHDAVLVIIKAVF
jgi:hypothetical protein